MVVFQPPLTVRGMMELVTFRSIPEWLPDKPGGYVLNLGPGNKHLANETMALELPAWNAEHDDIPCGTGTVDTIYAIHFLEHLRDPIRVLRECQRVLKPGGHLNVGLPYYRAQVAFLDIDHKSFWCEETWKNIFDNPYYDKNHHGWKFEVGCNLIFGIVERNVMLMTQLIRK